MNEFLSIYFYFVLSLLFFIIGVNLSFKKGIQATKYLGAEYLVLNHLNRGDHFQESSANKIKSDVQLCIKIEQTLFENQGFLREDITLQTLSDATQISPRKISAALKQVKNLSFPDYINSLRIQYIEEKVASDPLWSKYTFEAMAFECGFGSRSNFYQVFKKLKGVSPKTYFQNLS